MPTLAASCDITDHRTPEGHAPTVLDLTIGDPSDVLTALCARRFVLLDTTAPADYDAFGTLTLCTLPDRRFVLQPAAHVAYYCARVASGLHRAAPSDWFTAEQVTAQLWTALAVGLRATGERLAG